jgi:hypothetical protein
MFEGRVQSSCNIGMAWHAQGVDGRCNWHQLLQLQWRVFRLWHCPVALGLVQWDSRDLCDAMRCGAVVTCNEMECVLRTWISLPVRVLSLLMGWVRC